MFTQDNFEFKEDNLDNFNSVNQKVDLNFNSTASLSDVDVNLKYDLNAIKPATNLDVTQFRRTLNNTFELKFVVRFYFFFMIFWLVQNIYDNKNTSLDKFELFNNDNIDILWIFGQIRQ